MINFDTFKELYERSTRITLFNEEGNLEDFYREINKIHKPVCGRWHANPIPLTAVKKPFCGIATIDITVLSHPGVWEETRAKMDQFATDYNGTSTEFEDHGTFYSVSYNIQTTGVGNRILDVNIGHGEVIEITQQLSLIIIESGVSAYDTHLYIDGIQVPFLSLVETKTHTTSNAPDNHGIMKTMSEQEAYGIDAIVPYMNDELGRMLRDFIDRPTGNEAHCVMLDVGGKKSCHIMQIAQAASNVQPPQNIGINFSLVELQPNIAKYNGLWQRKTLEDRTRVFFYIQELINYRVKYPAGQDSPTINNAKEVTIFWGDGTSDHYTDEDGDIAVHVYTDGETTHDLIVFVTPLRYYTQIKEGDIAYGKNVYLLPTEYKWYSSDFSEDGKTRAIFGNENGIFGYWGDVKRVGFQDRESRGRYYIDKMDANGDYYIQGITKAQCFIEGSLTTVDKYIDICFSLWDGDVGEVNNVG